MSRAQACINGEAAAKRSRGKPGGTSWRVPECIHLLAGLKEAYPFVVTPVVPLRVTQAGVRLEVLSRCAGRLKHVWKLGSGHQLKEVNRVGTFFGVICAWCGGFSAVRWRKLGQTCPGIAVTVAASLARVTSGKHPDPRRQ
eukprot:6365270-Amphidinium_carterae.1